MRHQSRLEEKGGKVSACRGFSSDSKGGDRHLEGLWRSRETEGEGARERERKKAKVPDGTDACK